VLAVFLGVLNGASVLVSSCFQRPWRVFHRVFAVNLRPLGGLSQCMRSSRDPSTDIVSDFAVNLRSPRRVFHWVFAANLIAFGG